MEGIIRAISKLKMLLTFSFLLLLTSTKLFALGGAVGSHDPGALVKEGNRYWMFTTGKGIYSAYSTDLFGWTYSGTTVFPVNSWPAWINAYVPGFAGDFWAPECVFMNGKYYMYYSCSTFGSSRSAIGVASNVTLDPASPNYQWTDLGMVVSSSVKTDINAIDPAIIQDNDKVYMSYGSFSGGLGIVELDAATGLRKSGATITRIAGGSDSDWEAPFIFKEGNYYYLVANRGFCCRGLESTYRLVMGRSASVTGPYVDKNNVDMRSNGGSPLLGSSGRYLGPGHFGLLRENGTNFVTMHYYDGNDNGNAKLDIVNMKMDNGWPVLSRNWLPEGRYRIANLNSGLSWGTTACAGSSGQAIEQQTWANQLCQQWDFTPVGDGYYQIRNAQGGQTAALQNCGTDNGTRLQLGAWANSSCQKYRVERTVDGIYFLTPLSTNRVVEVPSASNATGVQLVVWGYNGCNCQKWQITPAGTATSAPGELAARNTTAVFPNPSQTASFTLDLDPAGDLQQITVEVLGADGKLLHTEEFQNQSRMDVNLSSRLSGGLYFIRIKRRQAVEVKKWVLRD